MEIWDLGVLMPKGSTLNGYLDSKLCRWLLHQLCLPWLLKFSPVPPPYLSGSVLPQDTVLSPFLGPSFLDSGACLGSASLPAPQPAPVCVLSPQHTSNVDVSNGRVCGAFATWRQTLTRLPVCSPRPSILLR